MAILHVDDTWLVKSLGLFIDPLEIYDEHSKMLGVFVPADMERGREKQAQYIAQADGAEIDRRAQEPGPREPFDKALARLKKLDLEIERRKAAGDLL